MEGYNGRNAAEVCNRDREVESRDKRDKREKRDMEERKKENERRIGEGEKTTRKKE